MSDSQTILLTGGAGFVGTNVARYVLENTAYRLVVLDALTYSGNAANLSGLAESFGERYRFVYGDITDRTMVRRLMDEIDFIVNMAAESHVDRSIIDATPFARTNVLGTQVLLDTFREAQAMSGRPRRFVHVSSDEVYGELSLDQPDRRFSEDSPLAPNSPYAASKAGSDLLVRAAHRTHGIDALITRSSNNLGPYQFPEKVIPLFVTNVLEGKPMPLYGDGRHVRDWMHVEDHCTGVIAAMERGRAGKVYNLGAENERSNLELALAIAQIMNVGEELIVNVPDRPGHDLRYAVDPGRANRELDWQPTRSAWPEALAETIGWYRDHEAWWRPLKARMDD